MAWVIPPTAVTGNVIPASWGNDVNGDLTVLENNIGLLGGHTAITGMLRATTSPAIRIVAGVAGFTASAANWTSVSRLRSVPVCWRSTCSHWALPPDSRQSLEVLRTGRHWAIPEPGELGHSDFGRTANVSIDGRTGLPRHGAGSRRPALAHEGHAGPQYSRRVPLRRLWPRLRLVALESARLPLDHATGVCLYSSPNRT